MKGSEEPAFRLSTILAAIDDLRGEWNPEMSDDPDEEAYLSGGDQALTNLRARFQPTEGESGHA